MFLKKILLIACALLFFGIKAAYAHPLDISISFFDIEAQTGKIMASTYLHPFEVGYLLEKKHNLKVNKFEEIFQYKEVFFDYVYESVNLKNNGKNCEFLSANVPPKNEFEIMGDGLEIEYEMQCEAPLGIIEFQNTLFIDDFGLQTNKMLFHKNGNWKESIFEKILTAKISSDSFDFQDPGKDLHPNRDTDEDGLTDQEENLYFTNSENPDTDLDGYLDKEEIDNGWDPRNPKAGPGQAQIISLEEIEKKRISAMILDVQKSRARIPKVKPKIQNQEGESSKDSQEQKIDKSSIQIPEKKNVEEKTSNEIQSKNLVAKITEISNKKPKIPVTSINIPKEENEPDSSKFFGTKYLKHYLQKIQVALESDSFLIKFLVLVFAYILGVLHSLEPGHGKSILIAYLADHKKNLHDALSFSGFMTFTHLLDVVILGVVFKIFSLTNDIFGIISAIQKWGAYILLSVSILLIIKSIFNIKIPKLFKNGKALGIASGLAPCTIGWALMIVMLSIGQINWLIPVIIVFGLGIFSSLMFMSFIVVKFKTKLIKKNSSIARASSLFSAALLFVSALVLINGI